jgi:hypothetical protein
MSCTENPETWNMGPTPMEHACELGFGTGAITGRSAAAAATAADAIVCIAM